MDDNVNAGDAAPAAPYVILSFLFEIVVEFMFLLIMMLWCYFMVVFTNPGAVPENWRHASEEDGNATVSNQSSYFRKNDVCHPIYIVGYDVNGLASAGLWSLNWIECGFSTGVTFNEQRCVYTFLETVLDTLVLLPSFIIFFHDGSRRPSSAGDIAILFLAFVLNLAFALSLLCFICMHTSLAASNTTSIEVYERKKTCSWEYDLGWRKNLEQVFGTNKLLWFLPMYCTEDLQNIATIQGLEFPTRSDAVL
ncbi:hypothetical protein TRIUR3_20383 [Triticum urartu]|uniref:Palmitoyltransferase n=1 Tax=Triticum urartu TaxID=4572 RepID=M8A330_TRIUA|nr:hypothetical protein TRIUR3_20383 [Triticum urartu]